MTLKAAEKKYLLPSEVPNLNEAMEDALFEDFSQGQLLGKGAYASTYLGIHSSTNLGVAMKIYVYNDKNHLRSSIESEVCLLKKLDHPNIVKLYQAYDQPNKSILILE